ncbi:MAG TPA: hypothetical protein VIL41_01105 [Coriobacteriia bacterium]
MTGEGNAYSRRGRGCGSILGWLLVVVLLGVLGWLVAVSGLPFWLAHNVVVPSAVRQVALDFGSQAATSARSVLPLGDRLAHDAETRGSHPHIVPTAGKTVHAKAIAFSFGGDKYTITPHVASDVYWGARNSTRLLVQPPGESDAEWTRTYYHAFADDPAQASAINDVCAQLRAIRRKTGLDSDQYLELIAKYVQSIPYDWKMYASGTGKQRFPVETLVDGKGLCGDKSVLLADLLAHEGYSAALLDFRPEKHMAVAVAGPGETYRRTGLLFLETTSPCYVTDVPTEYTGGMRLSSEPTVIVIGSGTARYTAADQIARIIRTRDTAGTAAEQLYQTAKQESLTQDQAREVNRKLDLAYYAATSLRSNVVDESGKSVGKFMDRTQAVRWIDRNAWWL